MTENIPFKRGKEDLPEPGLTAGKAMHEALKSVEERAKELKSKRKHRGGVPIEEFRPKSQKEPSGNEFQKPPGWTEPEEGE